MPETTGHQTAPNPANTKSVQRRSRLHYLYYLLAGFDLITVTLSLLLINQIAGSFEESVRMNDLWARRINDFAELSRLAAAVNGPGNDVFESRDVDAESTRFDAARGAFAEHVEVVRNRILALESDEAAALLPALDDVTRAMAGMASASEEIFTSFAANDLATAGGHMAAMDRQYLAVNLALASLTDRAQEIQEDHLLRSAERTSAVRRSELLIAGLMVLMIVGVTVYGARLARLTRLQAQLTEALVVERTRELEESHQRLRTAERLASIGTLAAGLGHDMNNVLFPVRCRLDVLEESDLSETARADLRSVRGSLEFLQQLSDGLRLLSADPERGAQTGGATQLPAWSRQVEPLLRTTLSKDVTLTMDVPAQMPAAAIAPHQLTQAIFNLVVNAGESIEDTGRVTVTASHAEDLVRISVSDTGCGMSEEVRRQAMDPFFTTKKRSLSTGLGLALVHGIVSAAGGSVQIDSEVRRGTTVSLLLPVAPASDEVEAAPRPRRALIALQDHRVGSLMAGILTARGWEVETIPFDEHPSLDETADAWIGSIDTMPARRVESFLASSPSKRVVLACDEVPEAWDLPGVIPLRLKGGLAGLMAAGHALSASHDDQRGEGTTA
jgi:signal transduction histidine kinase